MNPKFICHLLEIQTESPPKNNTKQKQIQTYSAELYEPGHELVTAATENCQHHRRGNAKK